MLVAPLLILVAFAQLLISLGILLESRRSTKGAPKVFAVLTAVLFFWSIANTILVFVDTRATADNVDFFNIVNRADFVLGIGILFMLYLFNIYYPIAKKVRLLQKIVLGCGLALMVLAPTNQIAGYFTYTHELAYQYGSLSILMILYALFVLVAVFIDNIHILRRTTDKLLRKQAITLLAGLALTIVHAILFLIVLPQIFSNQILLFYLIGYCAPFFYSGLTVYSLLRQSLFDVRLVIARSMGYVFSIATLSGLYGLVASFVVNRFIFPDMNMSAGQELAFAAMAVVLAFTFHPVQKFFNKVTNGLFYQDAYDPQQFIDDLNQLLVSTIDLRVLLGTTSEIINHTLKSDFCTFVIHRTSYDPQRTIGDGAHALGHVQLSEVIARTPGIVGKSIGTDYLEDEQSELKKLLARHNVAMLVQLSGVLEKNIEGVGYVLLGPKKSGNPYNSQDIRMLEIVANELVIAIQNALRFEEIQKFNITLQDQIERATHKLQKTNEKLRALDETKDDFISMASHQLRTPLTSVKGYLSMVIEGDAGKVSAKQEKLLNQAFISSQRMVYLIADLLNVSRLRTGKFVIESAATNLADVIEGEVQQLVEVAEGRGLHLGYTKPKDFPVLMLDETKIRQVLMNFIDNAIYYTPAGGHIQVKLEESDESITLKVVDDGIGVPRHEQHHLFTKFYRANNAKKARPDGTGLGLFMAKKVIIAQGGSIVFKSQEGKGSTFGFTFAKAKLKPPAHAGKPAEANAIPADQTL